MRGIALFEISPAELIDVRTLIYEFNELSVGRHLASGPGENPDPVIRA
jgi:hypothetical protein